jgi:ribosomal protein L3 glutamine methyltransferase
VPSSKPPRTQSEIQKMITRLVTVRDFLRWGFTQFQHSKLYYGHGTDNPWDEIVYLVLATLKLGPTLNPEWLDAQLTEEESIALIQKIEQRILQRIPTAYLVNQAWFAGLSFYVDSRVLIPRSPLAELIEHQFSPWIDPETIASILDLGTGSGCIAIACAAALPHAQIDAVDFSRDALDVASMNVQQHDCAERVQLIQSDGLQNLQGKRYHLIISNPPYVDALDFANLPEEYRHEPAMALASGEEGLDFIHTLLAQAPEHLQENGLLIVEVGNSKAALIRHYPHLPFTWLEFEHGEAEVFLLTREQLIHVQKAI